MTDPRPKQHKPFYKNKYTWYGVVILLVLAIAVYYNANKYAFINSKVKDVLADKTNGLYKITYDSISVDEAGGNLYLHNLSVKGDTILQKKYMLAGDTAAASMLLDIFIPGLKVVGFKTAKALLNKQMSCNRIIITDPRITIYVFPGVSKKSDVQKQGRELYKQILGNFDLIQSDSVAIENSEVVLRDFITREIKFHTFNTSLKLTDLRIDSAHNYDTSRTLFCKEISLHSDKVIVGDAPVIAEATLLTFDTRSKIVALANASYDGIKNGGRFSGKAEGISITNIQAVGAVEAMNLDIGKVNLKKAFIQLKSTTGKVVKDIEKTENDRLLVGWIKSLKLGGFQAESVNLNLQSGEKRAEDIVINNSKINISNLALDTTSRVDKMLLRSAANIEVSNDLISVKSKNNMYAYDFNGLRFNTAAKMITMKAFVVKPFLGEVAFAKKMRVQKDRYDVQIRNLKATAVDFEKLLDGKVNIGAVTTTGNDVNIYRDISKPMDSIRKVGGYPHQALYKLKLPVNIGRFTLANTTIAYKEQNALSESSGTVRFVNSNITISNITNAARPANKIMNLDFAAPLLGKVPLHITIRFYLDKVEQGDFQVIAAGKKSFEASSLNPLIEPMGMVRIDKGKINELAFNLKGDNDKANGTVLIRYEDLKLALLKRDKNNNTRSKKSIISLLANVVIKNNNPSNGKVREAIVNYKRDQYRSFFSMIWKFTFTGIKDIMGAKL